MGKYLIWKKRTNSQEIVEALVDSGHLRQSLFQLHAKFFKQSSNSNMFLKGYVV